MVASSAQKLTSSPVSDPGRQLASRNHPHCHQPGSSHCGANPHHQPMRTISTAPRNSNTAATMTACLMVSARAPTLGPNMLARSCRSIVVVGYLQTQDTTSHGHGSCRVAGWVGCGMHPNHSSHSHWRPGRSQPIRPAGWPPRRLHRGGRRDESSGQRAVARRRRPQRCNLAQRITHSMSLLHTWWLETLQGELAGHQLEGSPSNSPVQLCLEPLQTVVLAQQDTLGKQLDFWWRPAGRRSLR